MLPAVVEARENLRLVRNRYRNGQDTPTDIVDVETALTRAQQRLTSATYEYLGALASLDYDLGNRAGHLLGPPGPPRATTPRREVRTRFYKAGPDLPPGARDPARASPAAQTRVK
jgi:hypothetical protein